MANNNQVKTAIATVQDYLRREFIADGCRSEPTLGCISCQMLELEAKLDQLSALIDDDVDD